MSRSSELSARRRAWGNRRKVAILNFNALSDLDKCLTEGLCACDLVMFQEYRLSAARTTDSEAELRRRGWRAAGAAAIPSKAGGLTPGGLLTLSRVEHGLAPMLGSFPPVLRDGRVLLLHHAGLVPGGVVVANIYLESGVGVKSFNSGASRDLACSLRRYGRPYVVGAVFNCTKKELDQSGILK